MSNANVVHYGDTHVKQCLQYIQQLINYMADNEEYIGWTAWAAGPLWGSYSPCCDNYGSSGSFEPGSTASDGSPGE